MSGPRAVETDASSGYPLVVEDVVQRFDDVVALDGVNLRVKRGDVAVVIGGSGAGKTSLLRVMIGLDQPTSGKVLVEGENIVGLGERELKRVRRKFGMVFQYSALLDSLTVLDNVGLPLKEHTKLSRQEIQDKVSRLLERLELRNVLDRFPAELSGGMRKRVGLARALILEPMLVMYDEPTSGLDPLTARLVDDLILKTRDDFEVTSVVISHDMVQAQKVADRIYVLDKGRMVAEGTADELRKGDTLARSFFSASMIQPA